MWKGARGSPTQVSAFYCPFVIKKANTSYFYGIIFHVNENKKSSLSDWYPVRTFDGFFQYL